MNVNAMQVIMLITIGGFVSVVFVLDTGLKHLHITEDVRSLVGKIIIIVGSIVTLLLSYLLAQVS